MTAVVLRLIAYSAWTVMMAFMIILLGVVIAGIVERSVEDIL